MNFLSRSSLSVLALVSMACSSSSTPAAAPETPETQAIAVVDAKPETPETQPIAGVDAKPEVAPWIAAIEPGDFRPGEVNFGDGGDFDRLPSNGGFEPPGLRPLDLPAQPQPTLTLGEPRIVGTLDRAWTAKILRRYSPGLKWCYVDRLQTVPGLAGEVTLQFEVLADGTTQAPRVSGRTIDDATIEACFLSKIPRWRFTKDGKGTGTGKVTFTFGMQPPEPPAK